jgi:predicted aspartyl protease
MARRAGWIAWALLAGLSGFGCQTALAERRLAERPRTESAAPERVASPLSDREGESRAQPTVELALEQLPTGHIVIPLRIGDRDPMPFILDTGASTSVISRGTQEELGLRDEDGVPVRGQGAHGRLSDVRLFSLPDAQVGERHYRDLDVAVVDLSALERELQSKVGGILGRNFLQRHDVVVDFPARRLRLYGAGSVGAGEVDTRQMATIPCESFIGGLIRIEVSIDGRPALPAVFDLAAARSVINWHAARDLGLSRRSKQLKKSPEALLGADNTPIETRYHTFGYLALGAAEIPHPTLYVADLAVFRTLGVADGPAMVFGLDLLRDRTVVIDSTGRRIFLSAEAS